MISTIIILAYIFIRLGVYLACHGQTREVECNFFWQLLKTIVFIWLLYNAGLFNNFIN